MIDPHGDLNADWYQTYLDRNPSFADARAEFLFDEHEDEYRERQYEREAGLDR